MTFRSTKTYGHEVGLSCCFRQWRATSHCRFLHGYALSVHVEFEARQLDANNWVVDFGGLKDFKEALQLHFDHKLVVAADDPALPFLALLGVAETGISADRNEHIRPQLAQVVVLENVGCEAFAAFVAEMAEEWLKVHYGADPASRRVRVRHVEVREHGANSASFYPAEVW